MPERKSKETKSEPNRLYRSESNRMIAGVCAGLADYFGIDVSLIRILFITITLFGGSGLLLYILLWVTIPSESAPEKDAVENSVKPSNKQDRRVLSRGWVGILVVVIGVYFLLVNFGILDRFPIGRLWPVILIVVGLSVFWKRHE